LAVRRQQAGVQWMVTVPLCDEDKVKILSGNANRLFRL
jgi:predicted TIM-barrel fold metal-dependent hydrolase